MFCSGRVKISGPWALQSTADAAAPRTMSQKGLSAGQSGVKAAAWQFGLDQAKGAAMKPLHIDLLTAIAVVLATAATDAVYVRFTSAVGSRRAASAASWSGLWYLLSSYAVINYTENWVYVCFAAAGSWIGAYLSVTFLRSPA